MIDLYYWTTPNGHKITIFLEETKLPYQLIPVNISKGDQFQDEFLKISPNNKIPAMVDHDPVGGGEPLSLFESGAILLYPIQSGDSSIHNPPLNIAAHLLRTGYHGFEFFIIAPRIVASTGNRKFPAGIFE